MMVAAMLQQSMSVFAIAATAKLGLNIRGEFRSQQQLNFNRSKAVVSWGYGRLQWFAKSTPQKQQLRIVLIADEGQQQQQATRRQTQPKKLRAESSIAEDVGSRSIDSGLADFVRLSLSLSHAHSFQIRSLQGLHNCFEWTDCLKQGRNPGMGLLLPPPGREGTSGHRIRCRLACSRCTVSTCK
jgi:hypothetical protein